MEVLRGESVDLIILVVNFVHFIESREGVEEPVGPVKEKVLHEVNEQHLPEELLKSGKVMKALLDSDEGVEGQDQRVDKALVEDQVEDGLLQEESPVCPFPRPVRPFIDFVVLVNRQPVQVSR